MGFWSDTFGGGNSFSESLANVTTPGDGYEYRGGTLYDKDNKAVDYNPDTGKYGGAGAPSNLGAMDSKSTDAYSYNLNQGNAGTTPLGSNATSDRGGLSNGLGAITRNPVFMGGLGLISGGVGSAIASGAIAAGRRNKYNNAASAPAPANGKPSSSNRPRLRPNTLTDAQLKAAREGGAKSRIQGAFFKEGTGSGVGAPVFKMNMFGNSYEINPETGNSKLIEDQAAAAGGDNDGIAAVRRSVGTQATAPTNNMPAISAMSQEAAAGQFMPIPNPDYDPTDPLSPRYIINPTYDQLVEYKKSVTDMARGGEVESALGGNEKDLINDAEKAIRGELDETRAAIILAQYVQQYGEGALMNLVDSVRTGEADKTRAQFASGKNGMVRGNGDGSGVDDMVTAQLKDGDATQDVLLADGEFVMRKDATDSLQKAYGDGMLDKINDAGPNAAAALKKYLTA